jgi:hypothetical protein
MTTKANKPATTATVTAAQVREAWEAPRAAQIIALMKAGLAYRRAVRRSRRYFFEGKWAA